MPPEPDAAQGTLFTGFGTPTTKQSRSKQSNVSAQFNFNIPGLGDVEKQLTGVSDALKELKATLQGMSSAFTSGPIVNMLSEIRQEAAATSASLRDLSGSVAGVSGVGRSNRAAGATPKTTGNSTSSNAGMAVATSQSASSAVSSISGFGGANTSSTALNGVASTVGSAINSISGGSLLSSIPVIGGIVNAGADLAMLPLRFARERIQNNRVQALGMSQELTPYQWSTGGSVDAMMRSLSTGQFPGGMKGDTADILNALTQGRRSGAQYGFGAANVQQNRAPGFFSAIGQMQQITPGLGAGQVANVLGAQVQNTGSQQAAAFYTGGAFSMIKMGGGQKNIREWSEGILTFLTNQRPGNKHGVRFTYGELLAQNFPGSNVNAWFQTVGVSQDMMDYFWSYALGQAQSGSEDVFKAMGGEGGALTQNQAWRRLSSQNVLTRNEFGLAGRMGGQYAMREQSNQWFNQAMGALVNRLIPALTKGPLAGVQLLPDQVEEFLWNALETSGPLVQGAAGLGTIVGGMATGAMQAGTGFDVNFKPGPGTGDIGDYGMTGGTSSAGLNLDLRSKVNRMMRANPKLSINSGLRDTYTQQKLKQKGIGQFGSTNGRSSHYSGEAADIGPASQYGWLQANAHKFGLQTARSKGEPWHVQRAGTIGDIGIGDWNDWIPGSGLADNIPGVSLIAGAASFGEDIAGLVRLLKTVFSGVLGAMDAAKSAASLFDPATILRSGAAGVVGTSSKYLSLLTGGLGAGGGLQSVLKGSSGGSAGYDAGFAAGLPTSLSLSNISTAQGGGAGAPQVTSGGSLSDIYGRYAGGTPSTSRTADGPTATRIRAALDVASQAGFTGEELVTFVALAGRESNFTASAYNGNIGTGDKSYGEWQINTLGGQWASISKALGLTSPDQLYDPLTNAKAGKFLFDSSKTPFFSWGPYRGDPPLHGGAEQWVAPVYAIAKDAGYIGDPGMSYENAGGGRINAFSFNNTFHIDASGGGGNGGSVDISRLVPVLADKLESEMKKRLVSTR